MANLTLAIDDELLQKARQQAVKERTSVNALIRKLPQPIRRQSQPSSRCPECL